MAIYGTSSGGKKYTIGSDKGKDFINNAKAGDTLTGADGSTWTKNKDGSTTIVQNGVSYNVGGASRPSGSSGSSGSSTSSGGGYTGTFHDYSKPSGNWTPNAPKYTGGNAELDAYLALKSQEYYDAKSRNDARGMADAHNAANQARNWFGYSAENARDDINSVIMGGSPTGAIGGGTFPQFSYQGAPQYVSQWDSIIQDLADQILNREPFTYNYLEDPNYIALKGMYTREGDRAMQDTLGSVAARTGGMASSYAASAASQANNYFMSQLSDKIPELQQIAYDAYMAGIDSKRDDLSMLMGLESTDYSRYLDSLSQWNTDRNFGYGVWRDQVNDQRYEDETAYNREQDEWEKNNYISEQEYARALEKAQNLAASGNYDGYKALGYKSSSRTVSATRTYPNLSGADVSLIPKSITDSGRTLTLADVQWQEAATTQTDGYDMALRYTDAEIATMKNAYDLAQAAAMRSYSSGSGGSKSSSGGGNAGSGDSDIYQSMYDAGIRSEGDAYAFLVANGYNTTQSGKFADYYAAWLENMGSSGQSSSQSSDYGLSRLQEQLNMLEDSTNPSRVPDKAADMIKAAYERGSITESTARRLLSQYGFRV